jgi:hypothetical protein
LTKIDQVHLGVNPMLKKTNMEKSTHVTKKPKDHIMPQPMNKDVGPSDLKIQAKAVNVTTTPNSVGDFSWNG